MTVILMHEDKLDAAFKLKGFCEILRSYCSLTRLIQCAVFFTLLRFKVQISCCFQLKQTFDKIRQMTTSATFLRCLIKFKETKDFWPHLHNMNQKLFVSNREPNICTHTRWTAQEMFKVIVFSNHYVIAARYIASG